MGSNLWRLNRLTHELDTALQYYILVMVYHIIQVQCGGGAQRGRGRRASFCQLKKQVCFWPWLALHTSAITLNKLLQQSYCTTILTLTSLNLISKTITSYIEVDCYSRQPSYQRCSPSRPYSKCKFKIRRVKFRFTLGNNSW